ncbi:protein of unknown function [Nitrospira japonica]|uniref:Methyltransferase domain-containing protein n=1 Tax=Nitrospira japonica TaxID=1325564 RepID=A0A1W1I625_9BACT|nr:class I SAM-dependent methyltransferase [Nitrospira japonica]SLM48457.1 protein of unknown function [Nitrospira japonica]
MGMSGLRSRSLRLRTSVLDQPPSPFLKKCLGSIVLAKPSLWLDVPCGAGRNALLLRELGCKIVCIDNADSALQAITEAESLLGRRSGQPSQGELIPLRHDLKRDPWPFPPKTFAGIINAHFVCPFLFERFLVSLKPGGYLLCETYGGHGMNYVGLPQKGSWKALLQDRMDWITYREHSVGPPDQQAVTVKFLGKKRTSAL